MMWGPAPAMNSAADSVALPGVVSPGMPWPLTIVPSPKSTPETTVAGIGRARRLACCSSRNGLECGGGGPLRSGGGGGEAKNLAVDGVLRCSSEFSACDRSPAQCTSALVGFPRQSDC